MPSAVRNQAFACGMHTTKSAIVGCIKELRFAILAGTPNPLPVGLRNNTTLAPNIKRFLLTTIKRPTTKLHLQHFPFSITSQFYPRRIRLHETCLRLATNWPIEMRLSLFRNPSS